MKTTLIASIVSVIGFSVANAGTIALSAPFTDDASTGISSTNTYTHAVSGGSAATVNGVNFDVLDAGNTPANFIWDTGGFAKNQIACCNNGDWVPATGGVTGPEITNMLGSFTFSSDGDGNPATQTFSLLNLTIGQAYEARLYLRVWDTEGSGRPIDVTFTHGAESDSTGPAPEDRPSLVLGGGNDHQAFYVSYNYTAQATQLDINTLVVEPAPSGSFHMYALSNQVIPEPSAAVLLLGGGLLGLLRRRR